ncbi:Serine/threonine kinase [Entophlyctis luteolus]|nr:Serine/threonine kinase [Entophlyctis luteolus]
MIRSVGSGDSIAEIEHKISIEKSLLNGALEMYSQANPTVRQSISASIMETRQRIQYLESLLRSLKLNGSIHEPQFSPGTNSFEMIKYSSVVSADRVRFRLNEIVYRLEEEKRIRSGLETMLATTAGSSDRNRVKELQDRMTDSNARIIVLEQAKRRYDRLSVSSFLSDRPAGDTGKVTGNMKINIIRVCNLIGFTATNNEIIATIAIDGDVRYVSRRAANDWNETVEVRLDDAIEAEISVRSHPDSMLLGLTWFKLADLETDTKKRYPGGIPLIASDCEDTWIDLEPSGQLLMRTCFERKIIKKSDQVFRRHGVKKAYMKNGHKFYAATALLYLCAVCSQGSSAGTWWYQCQGCSYVCHAKCFENVITNCMAVHGMHELTPDMAITLASAFEELEQKRNMKEMEEAEIAEQSRRNNGSTKTSSVTFEFETFSNPNPRVSSYGYTKLSKPAIQKRGSSLNQLPQVPYKVQLGNFEILAVLGRGGFGKVLLVEEKKTGNMLALKAMKKDAILDVDKGSAALEKRIFQIASEYPFLVNMHSSFQDDTRLYFVMEFVSGGDLMCQIIENKKFTEARTKFYASEVLLALQFLHQQNIIHRDVKLENILLCSDGHIKLADYGTCKENMAFGVKTKTFCGTPEYMAPEILKSSSYTRSVDWWSFGVLIHVMLLGKYPFIGPDEKDILEGILAGNLVLPAVASPAFSSLLTGLLEVDPKKRLGGGREGGVEVQDHPFFAGTDWEALEQRKVRPPAKPNVKSEKDVSNFDTEFTDQPAELTPLNTLLEDEQQDAFKDFDFVSAWAGRRR